MGKKILILTGIVFVALLFFSSCNSPQERKGRSAIPINHPSDWERNDAGGMTF